MRVPMVLLALAMPAVVAAQTTGTISGTITSSTGGAPLSASVVLFGGVDADTIAATAGTNSAGQYSFASVAPGTYFLRASSSGFVTEVHAGVTCIAADCAVASGTPIVVTAGATSTVDVALVPGGSIAGVVRKAADGSALSSLYAYVSVYNAAGSVVSSIVFPGTDGSYRLDGLAAGTYFARTLPVGFSPPKDYLDELYGGIVCPVAPFVPQVSPCPIVRGAPITVTAGATTSGIDFLLDAAGRISGTVTGVGESVPSGTAVKAYSGSVLIASGFTDASGGYTITGLPSGLYTVRTDTGTSGSSPTPPSNLVDEWYPNVCVGCAGTPAGVAVTPGATTPLDFELATGGRISGTFALAPAPLGVSPDIQVFSSTGTLVRTGRLIGNETWQAAGLAAGTYYVRTANPARIPSQPNGPTSGWWIDEVYDNIPCVADDCSPNRGTPLALTAGGQATGVNIALDLGASIRGGYPFPCSLCSGLELYDARGARLSDRVGDSLLGAFRAAGLPTGTYYLKMPRDVRGRYPDTLHKDIPCDGCSVTSGTPVSLTAGQPDVLISFSSLPSQTIRGTVRDSGATPLSTITVEIFSSNGAALATAITTADGRYAVHGLNPGVYFARTTNQQGFVDVLYGNQACPQCDPLGGNVIVVASGADTTGIDFSLTAGTAVSGTLTTSLGPVAVIGPPTVGVISGGVLKFFRQDGLPAAHAVTDSLGRFETTLAPGTYEVRLDPLPGYAPASRMVTVGSSDVNNADLFVFPAGVLTLSPVRLATAAVGVSYRQTLVVSGGSGAIAFAIGAGTLPPDVTLDAASGVIAGTPSRAGRFTFTVTAEDSIGRHGAREYTLDVPACPFKLVNPGFISRASGEPFLAQVTNTCGTWTASTTDSWIHLQTSGPNPAAVVGVTQPYSGTVLRVGHVTIGPRVFTVTQNGVVTAPPFGSLDSPANGAVVSGSVSVSGWALDDMVVNRVEIFRDSVAGESAGQVFLGTATFVPGARPDVQAAFPLAPQNNIAGWGYLLLTNVLPNLGNGTYNLYAYAIDSDERRALIGSRTIVAANSTSITPFGAIDTPAQGGTIAGSAYINWGWALTPQPKQIPFDGSTIDVVIDGVPVGKVTSYNLFRSDVSGLFPGLKNSGGPVGYRAIDTTALSEGMHTIAWVVTDDAGQASGIGSRYFTVQNSAWLPSLKSAAVAVPPAFSPSEIALADRSTTVPPRIDGIDISRRSASLASLPVFQGDAVRTVNLKPLQGLELALSRVHDEGACAPSYEGYLSVNGELRALPIGSSLDPKGTFYWQPGPGFFGAYQFLFVRTSCAGERSRIPVSVRIH